MQFLRLSPEDREELELGGYRIIGHLLLGGYSGSGHNLVVPVTLVGGERMVMS